METFNCGSSSRQERKKTELISLLRGDKTFLIVNNMKVSVVKKGISINGHLKFHQQSLTLSLIYKQLIPPEVNSGDGVDEHFLF